MLVMVSTLHERQRNRLDWIDKRLLIAGLCRFFDVVRAVVNPKVNEAAALFQLGHRISLLGVCVVLFYVLAWCVGDLQQPGCLPLRYVDLEKHGQVLNDIYDVVAPSEHGMRLLLCAHKPFQLVFDLVCVDLHFGDQVSR